MDHWHYAIDPQPGTVVVSDLDKRAAALVAGHLPTSRTRNGLDGPQDECACGIDNVTNEVLDPCFATSGQTQLLCPTSDDLTRMVLLTPDGSLPTKPLNGPSTIPLALRLADGQLCRTALGGAAVPSNINGQSLTYVCANGDLYGMPSQTSPLWTVTYRPTGSAYSTTQTVSLTLV